MRDNEIRYKQTGWENKKSTEVNGAPIRKYERDVARITDEPVIRQVNDHVSYWRDTGHYFFYYQGDEILLEASTDEEAIAAGDKLLLELSNEYERN